MAEQTMEIVVDVQSDFASFPGTGDTSKLYVDMSGAQDENPESGAWYYWDGSVYQSFAVGPHPHPRPH